MLAGTSEADDFVTNDNDDDDRYDDADDDVHDGVCSMVEVAALLWFHGCRFSQHLGD